MPHVTLVLWHVSIQYGETC